ncbi:hypothetical protein H0H87_010100 [Tephrocybe sp. NHM501043]|nr:hypothetical protein H0H87_010100 [Tephrocybe sp. NHM501043]
MFRDFDYSSGDSTLRRHSVASSSATRTISSRQHTHRDGKPQSNSPIFSFDVLRSDPSSTSLQHIASSATYSNRGGSSSGYNPQTHGESSGGGPLFRVSVPDHSIAKRSVGQSRPPHGFINDSRKPGGASPHHTTAPRTGYSAGVISFPSEPIAGGPRNRPRSPDDPDAVSDDDLSGSNNGKKHVCSTCLKRFNRPSSLRIHVNTHTGATRESCVVAIMSPFTHLSIAFRCPWPNCAREFNVNSNMRRHYRNHTSPGVSRPQTVDNRRRRKRGSPHDLVFVPGDTRGESLTSDSYNPPTSQHSMEESSDGSDEGNYQDDEADELDSLPDEASPVYPASQQPWAGQGEYLSRDYDSRPTFNRYSQSHIRSGYLDGLTSSSSSSSPSPPSHDYTYSPSAPYSRSFADSKVSTTLRPAFHSKPVSNISLGDPTS